MPFLIELIIISIMLVLTAIFAAYELALASISRAKLAVLVSHNRKGAEDAAFMKDRMEASLAVVQLGMTLASAIAAATGGAGVAESLSPWLENTFGLAKPLADILALLFLIIPLSAFTSMFAELIPKTYALNNSIRVCLALSPYMKILAWIAYPVVSIFEKTVKNVMKLASQQEPLRTRFEDQVGLHELTAAVSFARTSRVIGARQEKIVLSAAQLSVRPIKEIILPISDVSMIPIDSTLTDALIRAHMDMHTRFPVCAKEGDPQTIQGYINFKDIVAALKLNPEDPSIRGIVRLIKTFSEDVPISQVLEQMIQERLHIALVSSKDQQIIGMIALEDIIEELVGEIEDEYDRLPTYIHPYGAGWIIAGGLPMGTVNQTTGIALVDPAKDGQTKLTDWFAKKVKGPLKGGEVLESNGLQITVRKIRRRKLGEAIVQVINKPS